MKGTVTKGTAAGFLAGLCVAAALSCDWGDLDGIPAGFADGVDNDTTYVAGDGLTDTSGTLDVDFAGSGSATTVAKSDHNHDSVYVNVTGDTMTGALNLPTDGLAVGTNEFVVAGGNVGVGTAAPSAAFEVADYSLTGTIDQFNITVAGGGAETWQSFTAGMTGMLTRVDVEWAAAASGTLFVYSGEGTGGALLHSQSVSLAANWNNFALDDAVMVTAGQVYTIYVDTFNWRMINTDPYPGGRAGLGLDFDAGFRTYVSTTKDTALSVARRGLHIAPRPSAPGDPSEGDIYYDGTTHKLRCYDGSTWQDMW